MKFFDEASEPKLVPTKPVESVLVPDQDALPDLQPVVERQISSHVVRVSLPSPMAVQDLDYKALLRREQRRKDDSQMMMENIDAHAARLCDDSGRCRALYPTGISPRLREPMVKGNGPVIRNVLGWARAIAAQNVFINGREASRKWNRRQSRENGGKPHSQFGTMGGEEPIGVW